MTVRSELVRLTKDLIAIPSVSDDAGQCVAVLDVVEQFCRALPGIYITRCESEGVPALVAAFDQALAKGLVLNAHLDVVPGNPDQFRPVEANGRIYGRGAQDMKGAAAAMLVLLKNLAEQGHRPNVAWQFVTDEEIGGKHGTRHLLQQGYTADLFLAGEPTDLKIVTRGKGVLQLIVRQPGNPAHGSRPWDGINPIMPLAEGIGKVLERYPIPDAPIWRTTVTPSALRSGDAENRVPVDGRLVLDIRRIPEDDPKAIVQFVQACFPEAEIDTRGRASALFTEQTHPEVVKLAQAIEAVTGCPAACADEHFASDARYYSKAGIAAVCFGPVGAGLHSHDEWVSIDSLEEYYHILERLTEMYL
jgi:succinyl-diaminopimelate desuccinylase